MNELIETKLAFLEQALTELSDVVYRQQIEIRALEERLARMTELLEQMKTDPRQPTAEEEKPPHY
jgi:uncharacterized coiled-coil protein SlyX